MEFVKNKVQEIWADQGFVSSQMDGVESWLVALEKVASSFSYFIIEHWVPTQAILINLHNSTCPSCQRVDAMADNGGSASECVRSGRAAPVPIPPPNSRQGEAPSLISPVPSLIVRKLDLSHLCFSLNFYCYMFLSQFPSVFLTNLFSIILFLIC